MLDRDQAAALCTSLGRPVTPGSLAVFATRGTGPRCRRVGRKVFYEEDALREWIAGTTGEGPRSDQERLFLNCVIAYRLIMKNGRSLKWHDAAVAANNAAELAALKLRPHQIKKMNDYAERFCVG